MKTISIYDITLSVKDANTRIELYEFDEYCIKAQCKSIAIRKAKANLVDRIHKEWRVAMHNKLCLFSEVGLTAKQLNYLIDHGYIKEPNDKVIEVKRVEQTGWM